jgi:hypothetical protein
MIWDIGDLRPGTSARISAANARAVHGEPALHLGTRSEGINVGFKERCYKYTYIHVRLNGFR